VNPTPARRDEIVETSAKLFASKGIASTTVRDIGEVTGLLSGSLYHHFKSKNAIVAEILRAYLDDIHQRFATVAKRSPTPAETVRGLILETLLVIDDHPHPTAIYQNDRQYLRENGLLEPIDKSSRAVRNYWIKAIEAGIADGTFRDDIPAEIFYRSVRDTLWSSMHWPSRSKVPTASFAEMMARLFFEGYANPSGAARVSPSSARAARGTPGPLRPPRGRS
jgi:AcrR family transcriptional regulator